MSEKSGNMAHGRGIRSLLFTVLACGSSWGLWWAAAQLAPHQPVAFLAGTIMPAVASLLLTRALEGRNAAGVLLRTIGVWRVQWRWYLFALTFMAAAKLAAAGLSRIIVGAWPAFGPTPVVIMLAGIVVSTPTQAGEELGWRGYLLPRLSALLGPRSASLAVGVIWATWHLPMFLLSGGDMIGQSFPIFVALVTALSVAMSWLYFNARQSVLLAMIMHSAVNNTTGIVPASASISGNIWALESTTMGWATLGVLAAAATFFLVRMPKLSHQEGPE